MKEAKFNTEVKNSVIASGGWAYKIADMPRIAGLRFNPEKPCDTLASINGKFVAIEGKMFKKWEALGLRHFQDSQIREMDALNENGNDNCFVFLNIRISGDKDAGIKRENRCIIFRWSELRVGLEDRSIFAKELKELPYIAGKKGLFDLSEFIKEVR
jgi:hypothetical protein